MRVSYLVGNKVHAFYLKKVYLAIKKRLLLKRFPILSKLEINYSCGALPLILKLVRSSPKKLLRTT
jgi:hypothetical protein